MSPKNLPSDKQIPSLVELGHQLELSQWWSPEDLGRWQSERLQKLLRHARNTIPFYRLRLQQAGIDPKAPISAQQWRRLPVLTRADLQRLGRLMISTKVPAAHRPTTPLQTSGSTGMPIKAVSTALTRLYWNAITIRDHVWHQRELSGKLAAIRAEGSDTLPRTGLVFPSWGPPTSEVYRTGPAALLGVQVDVKEQAAWLREQDPDYILTHPSNLMALAGHFLQTGQTMPRLREVRTYGETVNQALRDRCQQAWGVPLVDMYTATEAGYIALQCPEHEHYHVQSENMLVEILNANDQPCEPGEVGRVVITTLHNYAMPLIRYAILDYAQAGAPCPCGRGLPVLERVMGRQRNMLVLADGTTTWPTFPARVWGHIGSIRQMQLVQKSLEHIEVRLVADRRLSPSQENELGNVLCRRFGQPFQMSFRYLEHIDRGSNYKFEDFVSEVSAG